MTIKLKVITLAGLYILAALLILITVSMIADRLAEASRADEYNIRVRTITYGEVSR